MMRRVPGMIGFTCGWVWLFASTAYLAADVIPGQFDDFEDGTTAGWRHGPLGADNPDAPRVVSDGGPDGPNDAYLEVSSHGGSGSGGKLIMYADERWTGSYLSGTDPVVGLEMDLVNLGQEPLRLWFNFDGESATVATQSFDLAPGTAWNRAYFSLLPENLTSSGDVLEVLGNVSRVWFFHNESIADHPAPPIVAILGMDNLTAVGPAAVIPGDYSGNGLVEQADLDLVLGNWGSDQVPGTWVNDPPVGIVDQAELDKVLSNWGSMAPGAASVPEPAAWLLLAASVGLLPLLPPRRPRLAEMATL